MYELLKFVLESVHQLHAENYLNDLFVFENVRSNRHTRQDQYGLLHEPLCNKKIERHSVKYRGCRLYNALRKQGILPPYSGNNKLNFVVN